MTDAELIAYFNEHVLYELQMLRYSKQHLETSKDQLHWNAMLAAFNVSARNLYDFFSPKPDNTAVRVRDYEGICGVFERGSVQNITGRLSKLHAQCLHLGKTRTTFASDKFNPEDAEVIAAWLELKIADFIRRLHGVANLQVPPDQPLLRLNAVPSITSSSHSTLVSFGGSPPMEPETGEDE